VDLFDYADALRYGELHVKSDPSIGLRAVVGIHSLKMGPGIGGTRFIPYGSSDAAIRDVMRLARGMTYKAAISGLPHGGGKAVIIRPPNLDARGRERIFEEFGKFVDSLGGRYVTTEDSGTCVADMNVIKRHTDFVLGYDENAGGSGDPSPYTAKGVLRGIEAAVSFRFPGRDLDGIRVSIQGVGHVGYFLARELFERGASLTVADPDSAATQRCAEEFGATVVPPNEIYDAEVELFAPCALGAILNDETIPRLRCQIVAGASNNQLAEHRHGVQLHERGILYAPDYAINAGGLISVAQEFAGYDEAIVLERVSQIYTTMSGIFERSERDGEPTEKVADCIVEEMLYGA
jgi:leucine dehydrogenase